MRNAIYAVCLLIATVLSSPPMLCAHPGRTDGSGGHYNRKTGEYHYHNGGAAKQVSPPPDASYGEKKSQMVYVTRTGKKYHRDGCSHLKSKIAMPLQEARRLYQPCKVCRPPA